MKTDKTFHKPSIHTKITFHLYALKQFELKLRMHSNDDEQSKRDCIRLASTQTREKIGRKK